MAVIKNPYMAARTRVYKARRRVGHVVGVKASGAARQSAAAGVGALSGNGAISVVMLAKVKGEGAAVKARYVREGYARAVNGAAPARRGALRPGQTLFVHKAGAVINRLRRGAFHVPRGEPY